VTVHDRSEQLLPQPLPEELLLFTLEELAQDPFDRRSQGPILPDEAGEPDSQQLLEVLLVKTVYVA
jgi:hypothetical protein